MSGATRAILGGGTVPRDEAAGSGEGGPWRVGAWEVRPRAGPVAHLVGELPDVASPALLGRRIVCPSFPDEAAIVLGSSQPESVVDAAAARRDGVAVVRRRSGGGAVFVAPGAQVWVDVFLPASDPLLVADVGRSAWWLGECWETACAAAGAPGELAVHRGGLVAGEWSRVACFSGLGPGEVTAGGRKLVGISQRRDRHGAWLHSMALLRPGADELADHLALSAGDRARLRSTLARSVATLGGGGGDDGVRSGHDGAGASRSRQVVAALLGSLP